MGRRELSAGLRLPQHKAVPVADAGIQLHPVGAEQGVHGSNQLGSLLGGDLAGAVIGHDAVLQLVRAGERHQIAAEGHIRRGQLDAHVHRLQWGAAGIIYFRVIAKNRKVCGVAARGHPLRDRLRQAKQALLGHQIHRRVRRSLQRRFAAQRVHRPVGHAVAEKNDGSHHALPPSSHWTTAARISCRGITRSKRTG